jgi:outer membrane protein TolC
MIRFRDLIITVVGFLALSGGVLAQPVDQQSPAHIFTLEEALQYAVDHYPSVRAAVEQVNASIAGVGVARAGYLPRLDSLWQSNRGTANNIFGQLLPQSVIPARFVKCRATCKYRRRLTAS